jgi:hypothetical protein
VTGRSSERGAKRRIPCEEGCDGGSQRAVSWQQSCSSSCVPSYYAQSTASSARWPYCPYWWAVPSGSSSLSSSKLETRTRPGDLPPLCDFGPCTPRSSGAVSGFIFGLVKRMGARISEKRDFWRSCRGLKRVLSLACGLNRKLAAVWRGLQECTHRLCETFRNCCQML